MNTYTWKIEQLNCTPSADGQSNVVSNVHWRINAEDGTHEATMYGCQALIFDPTKAFVSYADLAKDQVIGWVQESMGIDTVTRLQEALDQQLEKLANPPVITLPLPWVN